MKHLYIIGNGFDIFTGLKTSYLDFRKWVEYNYPFILENINVAYNLNAIGEWWHDFEEKLGKLDVNAYVSKFTPPEKTMEEILVEAKKGENLKRNINYHQQFMLRLPVLIV